MKNRILLLAALAKGFYKKRWSMFIEDVITSLENNREFDEAKFHEKVTQFEWTWTMENEKYAAEPEGDVIEIGQELIRKYKSMVE